MGGHWTDEFSYTGGAIRDHVTVYFSLIGDDGAENHVPHAVFTAWRDGSWYDAGKKSWQVAGVAVVREPITQMVAVGRWGEVFCTGSDDTHDEHVVPSGAERPKDRGPLTSVRRIGKSIYATGMDRQVYRRTGANAWNEISPRPKIKAKKGDLQGFQAIDGFSEKDIYAGGWNGEIWHYDGASWNALPSITDTVLVDVCCAGDGLVYACGREGLLMKGRAKKWKLVDLHDLEQDFWSIAWFQERLYVSTISGVYTLDAKGLTPVSMGADAPTTCYRVTADEGVLWSIGAKDVMSFDGTAWTRID
jgi:hypothetical protein